MACEIPKLKSHSSVNDDELQKVELQTLLAPSPGMFWLVVPKRTVTPRRTLRPRSRVVIGRRPWCPLRLLGLRDLHLRTTALLQRPVADTAIAVIGTIVLSTASRWRATQCQTSMGRMRSSRTDAATDRCHQRPSEGGMIRLRTARASDAPGHARLDLLPPRSWMYTYESADEDRMGKVHGL